MTVVAWVLDLDADLELADPATFRASDRQAVQVGFWSARFLAHARAGAPPGVEHVAIDEADPADRPIVQAWSPTPRAHAMAERAGLTLPPSPELEVLRRVNDRAFAPPIGGTLPQREVVASLTELDAATSRASPGDGWILKRLFGFSGRGHKRVARPPAHADRRWAEGAFAQHGALLVEPYVDITEEFVLHGWLGRDGGCWFGEPSTQRHDDLGAWQETVRGAPDLTAVEQQLLHTTAESVATALADAGYFGAFAVDAYRWQDASSGVQFEPLGEINARYTMGWFVGIGERQSTWVAELLGDGQPG